MPFQGPNFVRNQNFTRDRNAGPPDDFITAEKVDNEFANVAAGLTTVALAAATADDRAKAAKTSAETLSAAAQTAAISTVRGGVSSAYDTLKKLFDWAKSQTDSLQTLVGRAAPSGQMGMFFSTSAPAGWLHCNGAAVSRTTYADLFAAIGTRYGTGNGSTTFNLPDCRDEFFRASGATNVGVKGGQSIQSHAHTGSTSTDSHSHSGSTSSYRHAHHGETSRHTHAHSFTIYGGDGGRTEGPGGNGTPTATRTLDTSSDSHIHTFATTTDEHSHSIATSTHSHNHSFTTNSTGSAETRPRFMAVLVCIKV